MDSTQNTCHAKQQEADEKTIDNGQLSREAGEEGEMDENEPKSLIMEIYPWISQFKKMCRSSLAQRSISSLKSLMAFFVRNARSSVAECYTKPQRAERLKDSIGEALIFFLQYYRDVGEIKDRDYYLIGMSDLLAFYIDMELKASKKSKENSSKISARLSSCLHIYLEQSTEYLLDTLLKVHFMNHNFQEILDPVVTKVFKTIDDKPNSSIMYVRYFLAYRLWKKLNKDVAVRNEINMKALTSLGVAPTHFPTFILESVLPQVPKNLKISTKWLLLQKFEIEQSCQEFLNFCNKERGLKSTDFADDTCSDSAIVSVPEETNDCDDLVKNNNNLLNVTNNIGSSIAKTTIKESCLVKTSNNSTVTKSPINPSVSSSHKSKKIKNVVFIDLTSDVVTEKVIRIKKTRRKLSWSERTKYGINSKIIKKNKNSSMEDASRMEDTTSSSNIESVKILEPTYLKIDNVEEKIREKSEKNIDEDSSRSKSAIEMSEKTVCTLANSLMNKSAGSLEWNELESRKNEKNRVEEVENVAEVEGFIPEVSSSPVEVSSSQVLTSRLEIEPRPLDQYSQDIKFDDTTELASRNDEKTTRDIEPQVRGSEQPNCKDKTLVETNVPSQLVVKPERLNSPSNEIINEPVVSSEMEVKVAEYASEISLVSSETTTTTTDNETKKIGESEFQDNIDGLSLLASVSQRISHLTTTDVIKVKNYASLANIKVNEEADASSEAVAFFNHLESSMSDKILDIYPESAMDKVAYQVEITSTDETDSYPSCAQNKGLVTFSDLEETRCNPQSQVIVDSTNLVGKLETNVILNGETVVLFQKSPNSNLYIINKAVENRDRVNDELANLHREMKDRTNDPTGFSYEIYDSLYRSQISNYDMTQYNRDISKIKPEESSDKKNCDPIELTKSGGKNLDTIDDKTRIKRKLNNSGISRRRRIKQEFNDCTNNISNHLQSNYGIQDHPPERPDEKHSIHIPVVAHTTPIYTKYPSATELYLPCHKDISSSITCGLPVVNPSTSLHSHSTKNTNGTPRCSCLNCTYGIMTHCTECIIPNGDTRTNGIDPNSYYMPLHSGQTSNLPPECKRTSVDDTLAKIYDDDQLVCNFQQNILDAKSSENPKYQPNDHYRSELDNKLPLKKRLKAIMAMSFVENDSVKLQKLQSYPGTPMLSIAALEDSQDHSKSPDLTRSNKNSLDLNSTKFDNRSNCINSQSREMIRRNYCKEMNIMPSQISGSIKNPHQTSAKRKPSQNSLDRKELDVANYEKIINISADSCKRSTNKSQRRISDKSIETETTTPTKKSTRQTRSSKRNVPKVNYIYTDGDSDWNPSGANVTPNSLNKRKRKKTTR